ncbi:hypothetical protein BaRGS_00006536, partial [Batillaria attramentaria]
MLSTRSRTTVSNTPTSKLRFKLANQSSGSASSCQRTSSSVQDASFPGASRRPGRLEQICKSSGGKKSEPHHNRGASVGKQEATS